MNVSGTGNTLNLDPNLLKAGGDEGAGGKVAAAAKRAELAPLLFGSNVLVSYGITDFEALVAQLKNENDDTRVSLKLKSLSSIADGLSAQQLKSLESALALADSVKKLESAQLELQNDISTSQAELVELALKIDTLEKQIENARQNAEDYNKNIKEQKAKRADIDKKIDELKADTEADHSEEIAKLEGEAAALDQSIKSNEDALDAAKTVIANCEAARGAATVRTAELEAVVARDKAAIADKKSEAAGYNVKITACLASIDESMLKTLAKEIAAQAVVKPEQTESLKDVEKREEKAELADVAKAIRDSLDSIAGNILEEIAERRIDMV
jgi:chromosome segregation ATPase